APTDAGPEPFGQQGQQDPGEEASREPDPDVADGVRIDRLGGDDGALLYREHVRLLRSLDLEVLEPLVGAGVLGLDEALLRHGSVRLTSLLSRRRLLQRQVELSAQLRQLTLQE